MKLYIGKKFKDIPHKMNFDVTIMTSKGNSLRRIKHYNPNGKNRDKISVLRTSDQNKIADAKQLYLLYRIRWNIELFNKAAKSGSNLKSINSSKKNIILIFILLTLLVSLIKTYSETKTMTNTELMINPYLRSIHTMTYKKNFYLSLHIETDRLYVKFLKNISAK